MQGLILLEEHKAKLLEMCESVFKEYTAFYIPAPADSEYDFGVIKFIKGSVIEHIHWFELCMTKLPSALDISFTQDMNEAQEYMWSWNEHERTMTMFDLFKKEEGDMNIYYKSFHIVDALYYRFKQNQDD